MDVEGPPAHAGAPDSPPAIEEARAEEDDGWDDVWGSDIEEPAGPSEEDAGSGLGPAWESLGSTELVNRIFSIDVCEVFSPPRVGRVARRYGVNPGDAMDLTTGWDFNLESHRKLAEEYVDKQFPLVVIGSPPCPPFNQLQAFSPDSRSKAAKWREGARHMEFMVRLYRKQLDAGRVFIHENPAHATSWALPVIRKMMAEVGVDVVETDQCMFGLKIWGGNRHHLVPAKTPTKFMTNSRAIGNELRRRFD